jgi:hypothetical protein
MRSIKATPIVIPPTLSTLVPLDKSILDGALFNSHGKDIDFGICLDFALTKNISITYGFHLVFLHNFLQIQG